MVAAVVLGLLAGCRGETSRELACDSPTRWEWSDEAATYPTPEAVIASVVEREGSARHRRFVRVKESAGFVLFRSTDRMQEVEVTDEREAPETSAAWGTEGGRLCAGVGRRPAPAP